MTKAKAEGGVGEHPEVESDNFQVPEDTVFNDQVSTSGLRCVEMRERRPWRHHIDYFGVAATAYCLLVGKYLKVIEISYLPVLYLLTLSR